MGKNNKKNRAAKKKHRMGSSLAAHQRVGKTLVPPLNRLPGPVRHTRWADERVPEMLWACLVRHVLPRDAALDIFRPVAVLFRELIGTTLGPDRATPTHSNLAKHHPHFIEPIVRLIAAHPLGYSALRPLLMFDALPGRETWAQLIAAEPQTGDTDTVADAIADVLWHQSEQSTDVRWLICIAPMLAQKLILPAGREEMVEEFRLYPNYGDLRKVRPSIRSMEQVLWAVEAPDFTWSASFWEECRETTPCLLPPTEALKVVTPEAGNIGPPIVRTIASLSQHWVDTARTTAVDAVHEGSFAFVLYALRCLLELAGKNRQRVAGRLLLRTIVECRITLAYLVEKNDSALWTKFRHYGSGQAKLILLKLSEAAQQPHGVSTERLEQLANEDVWDEFIDINLGSWAGIDLRKMAEESGTKATYDAHYGWASAHTHGQWSALRDTCLATCLNPLHRLHRVPLVGHHALNDVLPDAIDIVEAMIADLLKLFPGLTVDLRAPAAPPLHAAQTDRQPAA
jgi:hypothetical protein